MAKPKRRRTDNVVPMPVTESKAAPVNQPVQVSETDIARRAYEIYCERGRQHGRELDDWLQAERELRRTVNVAVA